MILATRFKFEDIIEESVESPKIDKIELPINKKLISY